jgi:hypothetical protein
VIENLLQPGVFPQELFMDFMGTETFMHNFLLDMFGSSHLPPVFGLPQMGTTTTIDLSINSEPSMDWGTGLSGLSGLEMSDLSGLSNYGMGYKPTLNAEVVSNLF